MTGQNINDDDTIKRFFYELVDTTMDIGNPNSHLDFLASSLTATGSGQSVIETLQEFLKVLILFSVIFKIFLGTHLN